MTAAASAPLDGGLTIWFTGLPSSGKTTLARCAADRLRTEGRAVELLDGDEMRLYLTAGLGFSREDRIRNVTRIGYVAHLLARNGVVVLCSVISPYRQARDEVRRLHAGRFFEVHVAAPVEVCMQRDVKGLYARAAAGEMSSLTGVDDPYEAPLHPELVLATHEQSTDESLAVLWAALHGNAGHRRDAPTDEA